MKEVSTKSKEALEGRELNLVVRAWNVFVAEKFFGKSSSKRNNGGVIRGRNHIWLVGSRVAILL